jgi:hypothetical protein
MNLLPPAKPVLAQNPLFQGHLRLAKRLGFLPVSIIHCEKYDHVHEEERPPKLPNEQYDVEGHSSCDVYGLWRYEMWRPRDVWNYAVNAWQWLKDVWDLKSWGFAWDTLPFDTYHTSWVYTVDSMRDNKWYVAEEELLYPLYDADKSPADEDLRGAHEAMEARVKTITGDDVKAALVRWGYVAASSPFRGEPVLWVNPSDPTVFVADERFFHFDMKDGWSNNALCKILHAWLVEVAGEVDLEVHLVDYSWGGGARNGLRKALKKRYRDGL